MFLENTSREYAFKDSKYSEKFFGICLEDSIVNVLGTVRSNVMVQGFERKDSTGKKETEHADKKPN